MTKPFLATVSLYGWVIWPDVSLVPSSRPPQPTFVFPTTVGTAWRSGPFETSRVTVPCLLTDLAGPGSVAATGHRGRSLNTWIEVG